MAVSISIRNPYRHTVSTVINMMKSDNDFYLRFSCSLPQIRSCTGFRITGTLPLTGRAGCTFKPDITLGRLFTFQGAQEFFNSFTYRKENSPFYSVEYQIFLFSVSSRRFFIADTALLIILETLC